MNSKELDQILAAVAKNHSMTVQEVRNEIMYALEEAQRSADPKAQTLWATIPRKGTAPTLEDVMDYLIHQLQNKQ